MKIELTKYQIESILALIKRATISVNEIDETKKLIDYLVTCFNYGEQERQKNLESQ